MRNVDEGKGRTIAAAELGAIFAQQSPQQGVEFIGKLQAGEERDVVGNVFAAEWAAFGAEDAAKWAADQKSINLGEEAASVISMSYFRKDPDGFANWKGSLPPGNLKNAADLVVQMPEQE